jgi:HSP20 family protein
MAFVLPQYRSSSRIFAGLGRSLTSLTPSAWLKPTMDIAANDKEYAVTVELPGVAESDVRLELEGDILKIMGEKKQEKEEKEMDF